MICFDFFFFLMEILKTARKLEPLHRLAGFIGFLEDSFASEHERNLPCSPYLVCPCKLMPWFPSWEYVNAFPHGHLSRLSPATNICQTSLLYRGKGKILQIVIVIPVEGIFRGDCYWHRMRALL